MSTPYRPDEYWQDRLSKHFNLSGVGHLSFSEAYNAFLYRRKANALAKALSGVELKGRRVLDIGSGTGFFVRWYHERQAVVHGVDITAVSVERLRAEFPTFAFSRADISGEAVPVEGAFDVINVWDVLYHIVDDGGFERALRNVTRPTEPGTILVITDTFGAPAPIDAGVHVRLRPLGMYQQVLPALGFQLKALTPLYYFLNDVGQPDNESRAAEYFQRDEDAQLVSSSNLSVGTWMRFE